MYERHQCAAIRQTGPGGSVSLIERSLGHLRSMEVVAVRGRRDRGSNDHDICCDPQPLRRERHKVSAFGVGVTCANKLLSRGVPSGSAREVYPLVTHPAVSADAGALGACAGMRALSAELLSACPARGEGGVSTALTGAVDGQSEMLGQSKRRGQRGGRSSAMPCTKSSSP